MQFWRLNQPEYDSDYADTFINGDLEHPFSLPGVKCERCGATWGGSTILPYELPTHLHSLKSLKDHRPISGAEHASLRSTILEALQASGAPITQLQAGAVFQPGYLDVPSRPEADFLWSAIGSVVVSRRIRDAFVDSGIKGGVLVPVVPRRIGKRRAKLPAPVPNTGEPEDLLTETGGVLDPLQAPPYFELVVTAESRHPPGAEPQAVCDLCGREIYDSSARQLVMEPEMWDGDDIFFLRTTLWIVVTGRVKRILESLRPTNLAFTPMSRAVI
jgi:hypothetical protein